MYQESTTAFKVVEMGTSMLVGSIVTLVLAIVLTVLVRVIFMNSKNEQAYSGTKALIYRFLHFDKLVAVEVYKIVYLFGASMITFGSIVFLFVGSSAVEDFGIRFCISICVLIFGNLSFRVSYEILSVLFLLLSTVKGMHIAPSVAAPAERTEPETNGGIVFCKNCGNQYSAEMDTCPSCGASR